MIGLAITAGSSPILSANKGKKEPMHLATTTVNKRVALTIKLSISVAVLLKTNISTNQIFAKLTAAKIRPQKNATLISFQITLKTSK